MPKSTLTYDLPEEQDDFMHAAMAYEAWSVVREVDQLMRNVIKHDSDPRDACERARELTLGALARIN